MSNDSENHRTEQNMDETAIEPMEAESISEVDVEGLPLLLGLGDFKPTVFQAQAVYLFLSQTEAIPIHRIVGQITYDASLWYKWKKKPGFMEWFDKVCHSTFSKEKLLDVHAAVYRRALGNSPADAKLFLQRFDPAYTERSQHDQRVSFAGYEPAAADDSRARQRKAIASKGLPGGTPAKPEPEPAIQAKPEAIDAMPEPEAKPVSEQETNIEGGGEGV